MSTIESRLSFTNNENLAPSRSVVLKANELVSYYQNELIKYCESNDIDMSGDNCSAMIMSDYGSEEDTFFFWID